MTKDRKILLESLAQAEADLKEFEDWKRTRPPDVWMNRSSGVWAKNRIKAIKKQLHALDAGEQ